MNWYRGSVVFKWIGIFCLATSLIHLIVIVVMRYH